jgi:hypothetical protein
MESHSFGIARAASFSPAGNEFGPDARTGIQYRMDRTGLEPGRPRPNNAEAMGGSISYPYRWNAAFQSSFSRGVTPS